VTLQAQRDALVAQARAPHFSAEIAERVAVTLAECQPNDIAWQEVAQAIATGDDGIADAVVHGWAVQLGAICSACQTLLPVAWGSRVFFCKECDDGS
jgi:hypothetical protein